MSHIFNLKHSDLFEDDSINEQEYFEFLPVDSNNNLNNQGNINIVIQQQDLITLPSESYLFFEGEFSLVQPAAEGAALNRAALINNSMMYLFNNITYLLNEQEIENINYPGQTSTMMGMLKYSSDYHITGGLSACWFPDTSYQENANTSATIRQGYNNFSFNVPLTHIFGFMEDHRKVLYGVKQSLRLRRVINTDYLQHVVSGGDATHYRLVMNRISWFMPIVKPNLKMENEFYKSIESKEVFDIFFRGLYTQSFSIPNGSMALNWSFQNTTGKPRYLILAFQSDTVKSKSNFSHCNVSKVTVELNTRRYPSQDLEIDFRSTKFSRIFKESFDFKKKFYDSDEPPALTMSTFKTVYPIFVVDISKHEDRTKVSNVDIKVKANFREATANNVVVYGVLISDVKVELQSTGKRFNIIK